MSDDTPAQPAFVIPGLPVRGSTTGKPIMALLDLLGRRWALGVIWQLDDAHLTFRALQSRCDGVSPTVLNARLKELRAAALVAHDGQGYHLTPAGTALLHHLRPLAGWSADWAKGLKSRDI